MIRFKGYFSFLDIWIFWLINFCSWNLYNQPKRPNPMHNKYQKSPTKTQTQLQMQDIHLLKQANNTDLLVQGYETQNTKPPGVEPARRWPITVASFLFLVGTVIFINLYGTKNAEVSANYYLWVTPPGMFFAIWGLIFALQLAANLINLVRNIWTLQQHLILAVNNFLLILWTLIFDIGTDPAVFSSFFILLAIIPVTLYFWYKVGQIRPINWFTYFTRNSYAFYLGWIVAATNLNFGMILVYWWNASQKTQLVIFWIMAPLCALGLTAYNLYNQKLYGLKSCFALWISVIWAFVGASITSNRCLNQGCTGP